MELFYYFPILDCIGTPVIISSRPVESFNLAYGIALDFVHRHNFSVFDFEVVPFVPGEDLIQKFKDIRFEKYGNKV